MKEDVIISEICQGSELQSAALNEMGYRFVYLLLKRLYGKVDRALMQTMLGLRMVITIHCHRNHEWLLGELEEHLMGASRVPAGTKRISNLITSPRWSAGV